MHLFSYIFCLFFKQSKRSALYRSRKHVWLNIIIVFSLILYYLFLYLIIIITAQVYLCVSFEFLCVFLPIKEYVRIPVRSTWFMVLCSRVTNLTCVFIINLHNLLIVFYCMSNKLIVFFYFILLYFFILFYFL